MLLYWEQSRGTVGASKTVEMNAALCMNVNFEMSDGISFGLDAPEHRTQPDSDQINLFEFKALKSITHLNAVVTVFGV